MTNISEFCRRAEQFRALHDGSQLLLLPNAWDALSASVFANAGFTAIATTSAGMSWSLGMPDGEKVAWSDYLAATSRIANTVRIPTTADIESGFCNNVGELTVNIKQLIAVGIVGINLEDSSAHGMRSIDESCERIAAARRAAEQSGVPIVINARSDLYLRPTQDEHARFDDSLQRCRAYLAAGADCVYPIGMTDIDVIARLVQALKAPVNIMMRPGGATLSQLQAVGVTRVSTASMLAMRMASELRTWVRSLRDTGILEYPSDGFSYPEMQTLFSD